MKLKLIRIAKKENYTIGKLYVNGEYFCDTLEDAVREEKIYGKTAIPSGNYAIEITYSPRFEKHLPLLLNVLGFEGVRIHSGNDENDTEGCILVGENKEVGKVINSRNTFNRLFELMTIAENISIEIV